MHNACFINILIIQAVIMEVQRMANIVPEGVHHRCREDVEVRGITIPKHTLIAPIFGEVFRGNHWENPDTFNPNRFMDADGNVVKNELLIPFSIGKRVCPGESLAKSELFLFFTGLLQNFCLTHPPSEEPLTEKYEPGLTISPLPFLMEITIRK